MKYPPTFILYSQICRYLNKEEIELLDKKLSKYKNIAGRPYYKTLLNSFDIERFKDDPIIKEDIWLYNYIKYEVGDGKLPRIGLIDLYERKIFKKQLNLF